MTQRAAGAVVGELLRSVEDPLTADWVVVKDGPKRATVHLGGVIGLDRPGVVAVVDAAELRAMLAYGRPARLSDPGECRRPPTEAADPRQPEVN